MIYEVNGDLRSSMLIDGTAEGGWQIYLPSWISVHFLRGNQKE